jgi:hypothetical protein
MYCYRAWFGPKSRNLITVAFLVLLAAATAYTQTALPASPPAAAAISGQRALSSAQIVDEMMRHNQTRADELRHYESTRTYQVEYKGYGASVAAKMVVQADYDEGSGKSFQVLSESGNKLLLDKVLKRLVASEKDADRDKSTTALTPANYKFKLAGMENVAGRPSYVLEVEPLVHQKYLYQGRIWVDAQDFAVAKIEAEPAKNPSFWISSTAIDHHYERIDGFWLPERNRSQTKVRIGGTAVLTIDYGTYHVVAGSPVAGGGS